MSKMGAFVLELQEFQRAADDLNMDESKALIELFFEDDFERRYAWEEYEKIMGNVGQSDWSEIG